MLATRSRRPQVYNRGLIAETGEIPQGLQFLRDTYSFKVIDTKKVVTESVRNGKRMVEPIMKVTGLFQEAELQNANGRIYPRSVLAEAIKIIQDDVASRAVLGEFDHPPDAKIHLDRVSHGITKAWMDGNKIYGEAEIIDNQPYGRALRGLFERKWRMGISSRGVGDMEMREMTEGKQYYEVLPGYQFVTWDAVAEPSVNGAILTVMEGLNSRLEPIRESGRRQRWRGKFLDRTVYENMLIEEISRYFDIHDFGPRRRN